MSTPLDTVLGVAFASAGSDAQAALLNAAGAYAKRTYDGNALERQAAFIAQDLRDDGWAFVRALALFDPKREV